MRFLIAALFAVAIALGAYAYSWKLTAESMGDFVCTSMLVRGGPEASNLLMRGDNQAAISLLTVLHDESRGLGRVCGYAGWKNLGWDFPWFLLVTTVSLDTSHLYDPEIQAKLVIALKRVGEVDRSKEMFADLTTVHFRGDARLAEKLVTSIEAGLTNPDSSR